MPGMAASPSIFETNSIAQQTLLKCIYSNGLIPEKEETIEHYAQRMAKKFKHENVF